MSSRPRLIREEKEFERQRKQIVASAQRFDEVFAGILFKVACVPESFDKVPGSRVRVVKMAAGEDVPACRIFFSFSNEEVQLLAIQRI